MSKPALTPEEWASVAPSVTGFGADDNEIFAYGTRNPGRPGLPSLVLDPHEDRHAIAALALYGQPFGFTREDVELLRASAIHRADCASFDEANPSTRECNCDGRQRAKALADRIEALLPPS